MPAPALPADPRFRRKLLNVVLVPAGLMLTVAVLLVLQIGHLLHDSNLVARSDLVLAQAHDVQRLTVDLETGLRGFLVTGDEDFLEPYQAALAALPDQSAKLYARAAGRPDQQAKATDLDRLRDRWLAYAADQIARRRAGGDYAAVVREGEGKRQMDAMRRVFADLIDTDVKLRDARSAEATTAAWTTFALIGMVAVVGGGGLAVIARRQVLDITATYDAAMAAAADANARLERRVADRTAQLASANARLGEMNKELEAFAHSVSHDLRAPMRHISGFADLLKASLGPTLPADDAENLATIYQTAKQAGRMVDDLLGFSRIGRVALNVSAVDLGPLVEQCRRELAPDTAGRQVEWLVRPIPPVAADPALLVMVLRNLLSNAVKYTSKRPSARVDVGPAVWPASAPAGPADAVAFAVTDNGVGFDMAYAPKLFGVFQRLHRAEDFDGTGIGLANVKRILHRLGGDAWAYGVPGAGATFYVRLPPAAKAPSTTAVPAGVRVSDSAFDDAVTVEPVEGPP